MLLHKQLCDCTSGRAAIPTAARAFVDEHAMRHFGRRVGLRLAQRFEINRFNVRVGVRGYYDWLFLLPFWLLVALS